MTRQDAQLSLPVTLASRQCAGPAGSAEALFAGDSCRLCRRSAWAGRAVRSGDLPWLRGKRCPWPEEREIMPPVAAPRVVSALRPRGWADGGHARQRGRSARRGWGSGAASPLLPGVTATAMPRRTRRDAESVREDYQAGALLVMRILANSVWGQWTGGSTGPGMRLTQHGPRSRPGSRTWRTWTRSEMTWPPSSARPGSLPMPIWISQRLRLTSATSPPPSSLSVVMRATDDAVHL